MHHYHSTIQTFEGMTLFESCSQYNFMCGVQWEPVHSFFEELSSQVMRYTVQFHDYRSKLQRQWKYFDFMGGVSWQVVSRQR